MKFEKTICIEVGKVSDREMNYAEAKAYAEAQEMRLPTRAELLLMVAEGVELPTKSEPIPGTGEQLELPGRYWTCEEFDDCFKWTVDTVGNVDDFDEEGAYYALPVREI